MRRYLRLPECVDGATVTKEVDVNYRLQVPRSMIRAIGADMFEEVSITYSGRKLIIEPAKHKLTC